LVKKVAIIGAGGIGFDISEYLTDPGGECSSNIDNFLKEWGIDKTFSNNGGLTEKDKKLNTSPREVYMLKRSPGKFGNTLGKTTGWIHKKTLEERKVKMLARVTYKKIDDEGLHIEIKGETQVLNVDNIIICAGQVPKRDLLEALEKAGQKVTLIGGAEEAGELDAKRAIKTGVELAAAV